MTSDQITRVCNACVERCEAGSTWPPDFAEFIALVIECYGVQRFFTDVENGYRYPEPASHAGTITHTLLDWASNEGFRDLCREYDLGDYKSPLHFRQRFILEEISKKGYFNGS